MRAAILLVFVLTSGADAAHAQASDGDERFVSVAFQAGELVRLRSAIGQEMLITFASGEQVTNVEVNDLDAYDIRLPGEADALYVKALRLPASPNMLVRTSHRTYSLAIEPGDQRDAAYVVRFRFETAEPPPTPTTPQSSAETADARYRLTGPYELRPRRIADNGTKTFLEWADEQALPAVFAINSIGEEEMVDGYMRGSVFTIDRVHTQLVFRLGKKIARARRLARPN